MLNINYKTNSRASSKTVNQLSKVNTMQGLLHPDCLLGLMGPECVQGHWFYSGPSPVCRAAASPLNLDVKQVRGGSRIFVESLTLNFDHGEVKVK